jgi:hypothetical protein
MDDEWVLCRSIILNVSAVQYSLDYPDYTGGGGGLDCQGVRTIELKLHGIGKLQNLHDSTQSSHDRYLQNPFQYIIQPTIRPYKVLATYVFNIWPTYRNVLITG